jgi:hypothetical protein
MILLLGERQGEYGLGGHSLVTLLGGGVVIFVVYVGMFIPVFVLLLFVVPVPAELRRGEE